MNVAQVASLIEANNKFNKDLQRYFKGDMGRWEIFDLGCTFGELSVHLANANMYMRQGILTKAKRHGVNISALKHLPLMIAQANRAFKSREVGSVVVVLNLYDDDNQPVVVPVQTNTKGFEGTTQGNVNEIASIYGKKESVLQLWQEAGLELYNKKTLLIPQDSV